MVEIKEQELVINKSGEVKKSEVMEEVLVKPEQNLEVESWLEKIEKRFGRVPKGVPGPQDDEVVVQQTNKQQPPVTLPVTQVQMQNKKKMPVENGITWLLVWAKRRMEQLVRLGRRVVLREIPEVKQ